MDIKQIYYCVRYYNENRTSPFDTGWTDTENKFKTDQQAKDYAESNGHYLYSVYRYTLQR